MLSEATKDFKVANPYVQFKHRETIGKTKNTVPPLTTGGSVRTPGFNETYSIQVVSQDDEIEFQLHDAAREATQN